MRLILTAFVGLVGLVAVSAQAAPVPYKAPEIGAASPVELVAGGCGLGSHHVHWRDHWGHWHWGRCVPNWR